MSSSEVVYVSRVLIERIRGPLRRAEVSGSPEPICPVYRSIRAAIAITTSLETLDA